MMYSLFRDKKDEASLLWPLTGVSSQVLDAVCSSDKHQQVTFTENIEGLNYPSLLF